MLKDGAQVVSLQGALAFTGVEQPDGAVQFLHLISMPQLFAGDHVLHNGVPADKLRALALKASDVADLLHP